MVGANPYRLFSRTYFRVDFKIETPQRVVVVGSDAAIGNWDPSKGHILSTSEETFPSWSSPQPVYLPSRIPISYKYALVNDDGTLMRWEDHENRVLVPNGSEITVEDDDGRYRAELNSTLHALDDSIDCPFDESGKKKDAERKIELLRKNDAVPPIDENDTIVICAFELPVRVTRDPQSQKFLVQPAKSALIPTLHRLRGKTAMPIRFVGTVGMSIEDPTEQAQVQSLLEQYDCYPVFPPQELLLKFRQFCQRFLWPLFHNIILLNTRKQKPFDARMWAYYQTMNKLFMDVLMRAAHESDVIWVHDFQLLLLPMHISRRLRRANVGLFLHTPFPSSEIFRCLPVREEILRGMLCSDLIGFHFFEYARHFLVACNRLIGIQHEFLMGGSVAMNYCGRSVLLRIGHVHIEPDEIAAFLTEPPTGDRILLKSNAIRSRHEGKYIFASVDRNDMLAGLLLKMRAFQKLLSTHDYTRGTIVLIQYAYPSMGEWGGDGSDTERELKDLVNSINDSYLGEHIELHMSEIDMEDKLALFVAADCLLDTSIREGLNLNPFEFICCHKQRPAALILSEFTGCARALTSPLRCNPWNSESVVEKLDVSARLMGGEADGFLRDELYVAHNSAHQWAEEFIRDLKNARKPEDMVFTPCGFGNTFRVMGIDANFRSLDHQTVVDAFAHSRNRVFFLDYEGTLAPDKRHVGAVHGAADLWSGGTPPSRRVKESLRAILRHAVVVILSGREACLLEDWFGDIPGIGLCGEHGFRYKVPAITGNHWELMVPGQATKLGVENINIWKAIAMELMKQYVKRTQGSFVENKGSALVFQYRDADPDFGMMQAKELSNYLSEFLFGYPVTVVSGKGYVEAKLNGVNKGHAVEHILKQLVAIKGDVDFILCLGDDRSDEDMFKTILPLIEKQKMSPCGGGTEKGLFTTKDNYSFNLANCVEKKHAEDQFRNSERFFTCTVGRKPSKARYYLEDSDEVSRLLDSIVRQS